MTRALVRPLTDAEGMQPKWVDGRPMAAVAETFIKSNDRLSSFERLELYNRMYWFRILGAIRDDCPGMVALLGERRFERLAQAYLTRYPSRSFTLRDLGSRFERFVAEHPSLTAPRTAAARGVARFEWAQTVAFDGLARPPFRAERLSRVPPDRLRLGLQPYVTLLALDHPIDAWILGVKRRNILRAEASNAVDSPGRRTGGPRRPAPPAKRRVYVAVHRHEQKLYHKRLEPAAYRILCALRDGQTLSEAVAAGGRRLSPPDVQKWFASWMALGWFCSPSR